MGQDEEDEGDDGRGEEGEVRHGDELREERERPVEVEGGDKTKGEDVSESGGEGGSEGDEERDGTGKERDGEAGRVDVEGGGSASEERSRLHTVL